MSTKRTQQAEPQFKSLIDKYNSIETELLDTKLNLQEVFDYLTNGTYIRWESDNNLYPEQRGFRGTLFDTKDLAKLLLDIDKHYNIRFKILALDAYKVPYKFNGYQLTEIITRAEEEGRTDIKERFLTINQFNRILHHVEEQGKKQSPETFNIQIDHINQSDYLFYKDKQYMVNKLTELKLALLKEL